MKEEQPLPGVNRYGGIVIRPEGEDVIAQLWARGGKLVCESKFSIDNAGDEEAAVMAVRSLIRIYGAAK